MELVWKECSAGKKNPRDTFYGNNKHYLLGKDQS
jgi:hypothetical protein